MCCWCDLHFVALSDQANHNARITNSDDAIVFSVLDYIVLDVCGVEIRCCFTSCDAFDVCDLDLSAQYTIEE